MIRATLETLANNIEAEPVKLSPESDKEDDTIRFFHMEGPMDSILLRHSALKFEKRPLVYILHKPSEVTTIRNGLNQYISVQIIKIQP